jgi:hypothetical protein
VRNFLQEPAETDQAISLSEQALAIREQRLGPEHPDLAIPLDNLAHLYQNRAKEVVGRGLFTLHQEIEARVRRLLYSNRVLTVYPPAFLNKLCALFSRYQEEYNPRNKK